MVRLRDEDGNFYDVSEEVLQTLQPHRVNPKDDSNFTGVPTPHYRWIAEADTSEDPPKSDTPSAVKAPHYHW